VIRPCFNNSPVGPPFAQPMPIPPLKQPNAGTPSAYTVVEKRSETEIIPGIKTPVWSYDGTVPGPTFLVDKSEVKDGANPISVTFQNALPPGDDPTGLIFTQPPSDEHEFGPSTTSVHLHGINADHFSDGYPTDGDGHRHLAKPGMQFTHIYPNNDYQRPATLWYHDHSIHITSPHVYRGLAGMYIVQDDKEKALPLPRGYGVHDIPLLLKDVMIAPEPMRSELPGAPAQPLPRGTLIYDNCSHMGAYGDVMTMNGKQQPKFDVGARKYRFRLLDGSDARQYMLALRTVDNVGRPADDPGANEPFTVIGTDQGLLRNPEPAKIAAAAPGSTSPTDTSNMLDAIHVAPAERMEFVVDFKRYAGKRLVLVNLLADPSDRKLFPLMAFDVNPADVADESSVPPVLRPDLDPSDPWPTEHEADTQTPTRVRTFEFGKSNGTYWSINGRIFDPQRADAKPALNSTERWVLDNPHGGWGHPIHIHLGRFRIRKIEGRAPRPGELTGWKDVVWLGPNQRITVDHEFWNFNGKFVFHCHNGSHEDFDMMSQFEVQPPLPPPSAGDPAARPIGSQ
jgi:spore coat protein A, manganese oxidase